MKTTVSSKGQIVLPAELRERDQIRPGQQFEIERVESGEYLLKKLADPPQLTLLEWIMACPEKLDGFEPIPSESTDTIKSPL
jgi:AbrB family looped-hinge helix DNA binding protein